MQEKIKIKKSEIEDMYDIEDDSKTPEEKTLDQVKDQYEITIEEEDKKLEKEFDEE